jgi:hypothetical protein
MASYESPLMIDEDDGVISQEDCWSVIQAYFDENVCLQSELALAYVC